MLKKTKYAVSLGSQALVTGTIILFLPLTSDAATVLTLNILQMFIDWRLGLQVDSLRR